jgi:hypothetical protein
VGFFIQTGFNTSSPAFAVVKNSLLPNDSESPMTNSTTVDDLARYV